MKLHQQFDLNLEIIRNIGNNLFSVTPKLIEELIISLTKKGYIVMESASKVMGIPKSITIIKEAGPAITVFASKVKDDFADATKKLGLDRVFE